LFLFSVLCTKNALSSLADTIPTFSTIWQLLQNWVITEVLVCPTCALREFIALDNGITFLHLHVCFSVFPSCVPYVASCIVLISAQVFSPSTLGPCDPSSRTPTAFPSTGWLPLLGLVECLC
jgi:hypothetical protein